MISVKERHQIERSSRAPYIYEAIKREGLVDEATNTRNMSLREIYAYIKTNDVKIGGDNSPIIFVSRADVEYTFKKFGIKSRKAGRKTSKSVDKADVVSDNGLEVVVPAVTTPVDTDECTNSVAGDTEKSVSTTTKIHRNIGRRVINRKPETYKVEKAEEPKTEPEEYVEKPIMTSRPRTIISRRAPMSPEVIARLNKYNAEKMARIEDREAA